MKLCHTTRYMHRRQAFPRQKCRGPIEANSRWTSRVTSDVFPRQKCRGPIEAILGTITHATRISHFLGRNAEAPLKPVHAQSIRAARSDFLGRNAEAPLKPSLCLSGFGVVGEFPRQKCRGPIEADHYCSSLLPIRDFLGRNAEAPLKRVVW